MATKRKPTKKQPVTSTPRPAPDAAGDTTTLAQLVALTADNPPCPPWVNKRIAVVCPLCHESHASPVTYVSRLARRGTATAEEIAWLREHLSAAGIQIEA